MKTRHVIEATMLLSLLAVGIFGIMDIGNGFNGSDDSTQERRNVRDKNYVTARASTYRYGKYAAWPTVSVTWEAAPGVKYNNILEYQILRDSSVVGVCSRNQKQWEEGQAPTKFNIVTYTVTGENDDTLLTSVTVPVVPISAGATYQYRIRVVYARDTGKRRTDKNDIQRYGDRIFGFRAAFLPGYAVATLRGFGFSEK